MEKYFECFNCKELIGTVYESSCCGKLYCQNCKTKLNNTPCEKCGKLLDIQRNIFAQRMLKNIKVKCKYNCGEILPYDKMKYHQFICNKKIYTCSFDKTFKPELKSPFKGSKKEILEHFAKEHSPILLIFMENHQNFEPILKNMKNICVYKKNTYCNFNNRNINTNNNNEISDLTNSDNSDNIDIDFLRGTESVENTSIEFDQDIQLLNGINDLNIMNSNLQRFDDLPINNRNNNNLNNSIREMGDMDLNNNGGNNNNNGSNENEINNNNNLYLDLHANNYQPLRDYRYPRLFDNDNNLDFGYSINNNFHSNNSGLLGNIHNSNLNNNIDNHIINNQLYSSNTRNRRRTGNLLQNNLNNNRNNNSNNNHNHTNDEGDNIRNLEDTL